MPELTAKPSKEKNGKLTTENKSESKGKALKKEKTAKRKKGNIFKNLILLLLDQLC